MPDEPIPLHPPGRVDIGALAGGFQLDAATRTAGMIADLIDALDASDEPLTQTQVSEIITAAVRHFDGFELACAAELKREVECAGVQAWGLPDELEKLLT